MGLFGSATPIAAQDTATANLTMHASVAALIVPEVTSYSTDCKMLYANNKGPANSAYCVYQIPLTIRIRSNEPWSGTVMTTDGPGNAPGMTVQSQALRYNTIRPAHYSDAASSPHMSTGPSVWKLNQAAGETSYSTYLALRVNAHDNPANFSATITYTVTQLSSGLSYTTTIPITFTPVS